MSNPVLKTAKEAFAEIASALARALVLCDDFAASVDVEFRKQGEKIVELQKRLADLEKPDKGAENG